MKHTIIGGGPVGLFLASKLKDCQLFDQKSKIGTPTRCTGILTKEIEKLMTKKELNSISENKINSTTIKGPKSSIKLKIGTNYIINNRILEELLAKKAINKGCEIHNNSKYLQSNSKGHHIRDIRSGKQKIFKSENLVGCDGPMSQVAKTHGLDKNRINYMGHQVTIKVKEHNDNSIIFYPHIGHYAWYVPETENTARVGVCTNTIDGKTVFDAFLKKFQGKIISNQSGLIPTFRPKRKTHIKSTKYNTTLIGDSAGHIKNTTGGGIIPGFKAAEHYSQYFDKFKENRQLRKELYTHFLVHNIVSRCNNAEWDQIINATKRHKEVLDIINRDDLSKVARKVLFDKTYLKIGIKKILSGKVSLR